MGTTSAVVGENVHHHTLTPPRRTQAGRPWKGHGPHQLVGMQAALHQQLAPALADQLDPLGRCLVAVQRIHQRKAADVDLVLDARPQ